MKVWLPNLKPRSVVAVKLQRRACTAGEHTKRPFQTLAGLCAGKAFRIANAGFFGLPSDGTEPIYEILSRHDHVQLALRRELAV
jgi:hypothetical protein